MVNRHGRPRTRDELLVPRGRAARRKDLAIDIIEGEIRSAQHEVLLEAAKKMVLSGDPIEIARQLRARAERTIRPTRPAYLSAAATGLLVQQRERVEALQRQLGRIISTMFVHTGKGPLQGQQVREFNKQWRSACNEAGYTGSLLHDLRRSGVRAMVRAGVPESVAQRISGHATAAVFRRYDITSDQDLRDARNRRAQFGAQSGHSDRALESANS